MKGSGLDSVIMGSFELGFMDCCCCCCCRCCCWGIIEEEIEGNSRKPVKKRIMNVINNMIVVVYVFKGFNCMMDSLSFSLSLSLNPERYQGF